ncbi:cbb3-type cytochrome oxidase subunit 3 [Roseovarius sp. ZX-A-9]|uniref:cbb3-type cytochrome oxidase subunit 3 n=1 Tax=Roseovarius sp. ZX-A-9 TaxID=3014783 RepID=UPI00232B10FF|nr:cbb3-type cytochrome c oxidase subunit 3 [Roseovarius sp. ZX-A-9]
MTYETLAFLAKTFGPIWMMGFFLIVVIRAYSPKRRAAHERAARSILKEQAPEDPK